MVTPSQFSVDRHTAVVRGVWHETTYHHVHPLIPCCRYIDMLCGSVDPMGASAGDGEVSVVLGVKGRSMLTL